MKYTEKEVIEQIKNNNLYFFMFNSVMVQYDHYTHTNDIFKIYLTFKTDITYNFFQENFNSIVKGATLPPSNNLNRYQLSDFILNKSQLIELVLFFNKFDDLTTFL